MEPKNATKTVYSLYYPETRKIIDELWKSRPHHLYEDNDTKTQDEMHKPYLELWRNWSRLQGLEQFPNLYPTNGASEAIDHLIMRAHRPVHVFHGEYEGYAAIADACGIPVIRHDRYWFDQMEIEGDGVFYVSAPSAIDGEMWPWLNHWLEHIQRFHPQIDVILDVTYVGAAKRHVELDVGRHPNVKAVVFSLSKPFGVYYHRIGGVVSREPIKTLYGNLWFKNLFSIIAGTALMWTHTVDDLPKRYADVQVRALANLISAGKVPNGTMASNVILLAQKPCFPQKGFEDFARTEYNMRFCLKAEMARIIKQEQGVKS